MTQQPRALELRPIGIIRSPWHETLDTPIQPAFAEGALGEVQIDPSYAEALTDIEGFERIWLIYWFDRAASYQPPRRGSRILEPRQPSSRARRAVTTRCS